MLVGRVKPEFELNKTPSRVAWKEHGFHREGLV
jgi:hypothetical protein